MGITRKTLLRSHNLFILKNFELIERMCILSSNSLRGIQTKHKTPENNSLKGKSSFKTKSLLSIPECYYSDEFVFFPIRKTFLRFMLSRMFVSNLSAHFKR